MCGRFNVIDNPELQQLLRELGIDLGLPSRSNIAPTETIFLVRAPSEGPATLRGSPPPSEGPATLRGSPPPSEGVEVRWWLTPRWAKAVDQKYSMFNARSETLATSRAFAEPFKHRRGIVPVSSFIEWRTEEGGRQPYLIETPGAALALAAIWEHWEGDGQVIESCALVTTAAAPEFSQFHNRMPVILHGEERRRWLDITQPLAADDPLFTPRLKQPLQVAPIARAVNNARHKELALLAPLAPGLLLTDAGTPG